MRSFLYLHGFASSPNSVKAQDLRDRFHALNIPLLIPDLNQGDFSHLTLSRQIQQVEALLPSDHRAVTIIGSSFGGLTAAWVGQRCVQVDRLVLLAPAFCFLDHWLPRLSAEQVQRWQTEQALMVYHYAEQQMLPIRYDLVLDMANYNEAQLQRPIPTLILHGRSDDVIPIQSSRNYAASRHWVRLIELDSDHALGNVQPQIWQAIQEFALLS